MKLNRLNDVFFKYLLGDVKRKTLTLSFINSILNRTEDNVFTDLDFLDKELTPIEQDGKVSVLDIRARMNDGTQVNIEVQVCKDPDMARRSLYYWSKMYSGELHEGEPYNKLMQAISINLMDFNAFPEYTSCHHSYHICNDETNDRLLDDLEMHFIELEKIRIGDIRNLKKSEQWIAYFSNQCSDEEREVLAMSEPAIKDAIKARCILHKTKNCAENMKYRKSPSGLHFHDGEYQGCTGRKLESPKKNVPIKNKKNSVKKQEKSSNCAGGNRIRIIARRSAL